MVNGRGFCPDLDSLIYQVFPSMVNERGWCPDLDSLIYQVFPSIENGVNGVLIWTL